MTDATFDFLITGLSEKRALRFSAALDTLTAYEADPVITKTEFKDLCDQFYKAFDEANKKLLGEVHVYAGKWENLTEAEHKLDQALFMPYVHVVGSYLKKINAFKGGDTAYVVDARRLYTEIAPLAERVLALKVKIGKRAPKATKTSIERDERDAKAMTCQCCARKILAETGQIAHHGYERPGDGYQTASCPGALHLPFEVERGALELHIRSVSNALVQYNIHTVKIRDEEVGFGWSYTARGAVAWTPIKKTVTITRETFDEAVKTWAAERQYQEQQPTFDDLKARTLAMREGQRKRELDYIHGQQHRYDHWTQTHERRDGAWVALAA
ncbi:hypothetical protein BAJUN_00590 [Bajunvirus bajun]|uniref:Uncharacterized protein n=1 Tax=Brevundimonas phage vB_BgoS-Bajun TaxID=2948594 RepID=A0A9E7SRX0_9CAUD|nr:hypothetical protein BAJUN_00590 [Brevundimonas phage vB_BgoS-Bajun]